MKRSSEKAAKALSTIPSIENEIQVAERIIGEAEKVYPIYYSVS